MKQMIVQIYEIQEPREAERLIEMGVDRIGSVILSRDVLKNPSIREVVRLIRGTGAKSSLITLLAREDDILRALDYHEPVARLPTPAATGEGLSGSRRTSTGWLASARKLEGHKRYHVGAREYQSCNLGHHGV